MTADTPQEGTGDRDTIIQFLVDNARRHAELDCMRYLKRGEYVGITWKETMDVTRLLALGFQAIGLPRQARVALMAKTRYEWRLLDYGIMFAGCTTVTLYPSLTTAQVEYIVNDSGSTVLVVDTPSNLKKAIKAKPSCPRLQHVISIEPVPDDLKGHGILTLDDLIQKGQEIKLVKGLAPGDIVSKLAKLEKQLAKEHRKAKVDALVAEGRALDSALLKATGDPFIVRYSEVTPDDVATIVYTSGTTGVPKGAVLSHRNMAVNAWQTAGVIPVKQHDVTLSFLPMSHVLGRQVDQFLATLVGFTVAFARDTDSLIENLDQVKPTFITSVPRIYEKLYDRIIADVVKNETKRKIFDHAVDWGHEYQSTVQAGEDVSIPLAAKNFLADHLVFKKIKEILGGRLRFMFSGGAALNPVLAKFFFAAGFKIMEGYGLTETSPVLTVNRIDAIHPGTVGKPVPRTEIRIAPDGEITCKGPQVFSGYWNKPDETADAFDADGWYHTGDLGTITPDGDVKITGRKKTVIVLRTGKKVSPVVTEAAVDLDRHVAHSCVIGDDMKYLVAVIEPNFEYLVEWMEEEGLTTLKPADYELFHGMSKDAYEAAMARRKQAIELPEVRDFYQRILDENQKNLSDFERIKQFVLVAEEWNEYNVLTPSMKMRRAEIVARYKDDIARLVAE